MREALPVRSIGGTDHDTEQKAQRVGNHVSFSTFTLFARVAPSARTALTLGLDRLGIDDRSTGTGLPSCDHAGRPPNPVTKLLKEVLTLPFSKVVVDCLPWRKGLRKHAPLQPAFHQIEYRIQKLAGIVLHKPEAIKNRLNSFPFLVGQIKGIGTIHRSEFVL
jgi:hypothetical protein